MKLRYRTPEAKEWLGRNGKKKKYLVSTHKKKKEDLHNKGTFGFIACNFIFLNVLQITNT